MPSPPQPDVKPSPLLHAEKVYFLMRENAREVREGDVPMLIWEGFTTHLLKELKLAVPYYSTIRTALIKMGCVRQLRRGGGSSPSQWELIREPSLDLWVKMQEEAPDQPVRAGTASAASKGDIKHLRQQFNDLRDRVDGLEENLKFVVNLFNESLAKKGA